MTEPVWLTEEQHRAWRSFKAMETMLNSRLGASLQRDFGLSPADYRILVELSEAPDGRMRAFELGEATQWEKSRISHQLSRMAQRGLVERQQCSEDSRYSDVVLTEAGRAAIVGAAPQHVANVRELFIDALTPEQLKIFGEACEAVLTRIKSQG
ncbi:MarR family winged helix-turn-helix transcriptional regulator [Allokutzneria sp. A3M-2-11 16]|uniref:MarR family winged helix-turn-helix transcriptional regulator n=1 Tax=Allokutzneria sp. A3M-2-11 16 TaxID=2962043 RepID=UPI0020B785BB|nr:MarR family winged helix-turn-helix transcriptional regulator [Allokutzneria sp. A3M-2-11 16]MCP3805193.1 MarR family winged helix-turn-helix transcriptional regulator [Allokutzneria sp. A3M-2-11 16]